MSDDFGEDIPNIEGETIYSRFARKVEELYGDSEWEAESELSDNVNERIHKRENVDGTYVSPELAAVEFLITPDRLVAQAPVLDNSDRIYFGVDLEPEEYDEMDLKQFYEATEMLRKWYDSPEFEECDQEYQG